MSTWKSDWDAIAAKHPKFREQWASDPVAWAPVLDLHAGLHAQTPKAGGSARGAVQLPPIARRLFNFTVAVTAHIAAGSPVVSDAVFDKRRAICAVCPLFNARAGACSLCGCPAKALKWWPQKLRWADQSCPGDPPRWTAEPVIESLSGHAGDSILNYWRGGNDASRA